ncbi:MAG TPA: DUF3592 domain-containing protein [Candidatus Limnocylindria bacterium]|nr:DUF3592 domain-containing protein [Candidatus Limnocylindria bacterium]
MATKRWRATIDAISYDIEARVSTWSGRVAVLVNGTEVARGGAMRDTTRRINFPLGRRLATLTWMTYGRGSTHYDVVLDGRSMSTGRQARPKENPYESLGASWFLLIAVVGILGGVLWFGALPEIRLGLEGREAPARVSGGHVTSGRSTSYYLAYRFVAADGTTMETEGRVSYDTYRSTRAGDVIAVIYVPSAPEIQRPDSYDERIALVALVSMFGAMLPFTAAMVSRARRLRAITAALADRAIRTSATVDKVSKEWIGQGMRRISYRYEDADGRARRGRSPKLYPEEAGWIRARLVGDNRI